MKRVAAGFSILELMMVVAIVGILATMADVGVDYYQLRRQRTEAAELIKNINTAQMAYRNAKGAFGTLTELNDWKAGLASDRFAIDISVPLNGSYLEYTAKVTANSATIDPSCTVYTLRVTGPLIEQKSYDANYAETTGVCLGKSAPSTHADI